MRNIIRSLVAGSLLTVCSAAWSTIIAYNFTTTGFLPGPAPIGGLAGPVSGSFSYDNAAPFGTNIMGGVLAGSSVYGGAILNLSGSVDGHSFSDPGGIAVVGDDRFSAFPTPTDFFSLFAEGIVTDLSGFSVVDSTLGLLTLANVRLQWLEGQVGITDFLSGQSLPGTVPGFGGVLVLDFVDAGGVTRNSFYTLQVTRVPEPGTIALFSVGLLVLSLARRTRRAGVGPHRQEGSYATFMISAAKNALG